MTNYDAKISINFKFSSQQLLDNYLKSIYISLKADKDLDTNIEDGKDKFKNSGSYNKHSKTDIKIKKNCLEINIHTDDISEIRALINSYLRLFNVTYSCLNTLQ